MPQSELEPDHSIDIINAVLVGEDLDSIAQRWQVSVYALGKWLEDNRQLIEDAIAQQAQVLRLQANSVVQQSLKDRVLTNRKVEESYDKDGILVGKKVTTEEKVKPADTMTARFVLAGLDPQRYGDSSRSVNGGTEPVKIIVDSDPVPPPEP